MCAPGHVAVAAQVTAQCASTAVLDAQAEAAPPQSTEEARVALRVKRAKFQLIVQNRDQHGVPSTICFGQQIFMRSPPTKSPDFMTPCASSAVDELR
jgi:hypothetical protein